MKIFFYILSFVFLLTGMLPAQTLHLIQTVGSTFSPSDLTINVGDTVRWKNTGGGFHNVAADDGSYRSGDASTSQWVFDHVFTTVGDSRYYCEIHGGKGGVGMSGIIHVTNATGISEEGTEIKTFKLDQNYPNPFNPSTIIEFTLPETEFVTLKVFNMLGLEVATLVSKKLNPGRHTYTFDGKNLASGYYYYQMSAGNYREVKRMILIK